MPTFRPRACMPSAWLASALLFLMVATIPASAQVIDAFSAEQRQAVMAQQARQQTMERLLSGTLALEGAIDPNGYIVGPGDVFSVAVGGALASETPARVSADGLLVIPEVGSFPVAGLTLAEARSRVQAGLRRVYRNVETQVALAQPRQFFVHVSGAVERPGRHVMIPIGRVEDAVTAAMESLSPLAVYRTALRAPIENAPIPALRNVEVRRTDGSRVSVDLIRYYATGDPAHNPYLLDGDGVFVPAFERRSARVVFIEHEREPSASPVGTRERAYDYRSDDTVTALILAEGGRELLAETNAVRLLRTDEHGRVHSEEIDLVAIRAGAAPDVPLRPLDRVQIRRADTRPAAASIVGFVRHPGTYPIADNRTTLRDLVEAAGGILLEGHLRGAYLERRGPDAGGPADDLRDAVQTRDPADDRAARAAALERASFEHARLSDLPFGSRQYMVREMLQFQRVSLDLRGDPVAIPDVVLRDGDRFVVPEDRRSVLVVGQVRNPGYVAFVDGAAADDYVRMAGGRGPAATDAYVREVGSGALRLADRTPLHSGDIVFVDRALIADTESLQALALQEQQLEFQREQQRRTARLQLFQTGISVVSTAAAIVTTYLLIRRD
jgi:polysaccharide biosynthesis/export protein